MIQADDFITCARNVGYSYYAGVPCSFLTPFINYTIADRRLTYVSSANEGDALAAAAGAVIGGQRAVVMMQNSGLGNAVNPLTSLAHVFRIPVLIIVTLRGDPELADEPQHRLLGSVTPRLFDMLDIPWDYFPVETDQIEPTLMRAERYMADAWRPYALIMRKGSVAPYDLPDGHAKEASSVTETADKLKAGDRLQKDLKRHQVLKRVIELTDETKTVVIATTGYTGRELCAMKDRANQFYMVGSMGCASSLGLGLSMARPDLRIVIIDGDGAALMRMGNFATLGAYGGDNLIHLLLDNGAYESTGAQATVSPGVSFSGVAKACGYPFVLSGNDWHVLDDVLSQDQRRGPRFAHIKIQTGTLDHLPRPELSPEETRHRLMEHIGSKLMFPLLAA